MCGMAGEFISTSTVLEQRGLAHATYGNYLIHVPTTQSPSAEDAASNEFQVLFRYISGQWAFKH